VTTGTPDTPEEVRRQLDRLEIEAGRPLLISDADEVLFAFMMGFEAYMERQGAYFDWSSFRLNGNIRSKEDGTPLGPAEVRALLTGFFHDETRNIAPIAGAARSLNALSRRMQIVVLSNVPHAQHGDRRHALTRHGMDYPLVANQGSKAPAVKLLAERVGGPVIFIDDSPSHHREVAELAPDVRRIHFIGNQRLAALLEQAEHSHYRARSWDDMRRHIESYLSSEGF
jgi:hypothetical protein